MRLGVASTMANIRENWWIPKLRAKAKKIIQRCNACKVFSTRPYGTRPTSALPELGTEGSRPFEVIGVDHGLHRASWKETRNSALEPEEEED